jgi:hypothetical protein
MKNNNLFILLLILLLNLSCQSTQRRSEINKEQNVNEPTTVQTTQTSVNSNQNKALTKSFESLYQKSPRRKKIEFPEDCSDITPAGEEVDYLSVACAEALRSARDELQKIAETENCSYPVTDENNKSSVVVDDEEMLFYKIKTPEETNIETLTKKLGTVVESFIKNNQLDFPIELKVGQELKYQKAHYAYDFNPLFYPFSDNKYLVKIKCWTAAYNLSNIYLLYDESSLPSKVKILEFSWVQPKAHIYDDFSYLKPPSDNYIAKHIEIVKEKTLPGFHFNSDTKTLTAYSKGNGMGKFGQYARYSFKKDGEPVLKEFRARFYDDVYNQNYPNYDYDDVIKNPPKTWKRYYPK